MNVYSTHDSRGVGAVQREPREAADDASRVTGASGVLMGDADFFDADEGGDETRVAIMRATYRALCSHGYADLTIQRIGDEFDRSKSLLYHHYDGKEDLLVDFLAFMLGRLQDDVVDEPGFYDESIERDAAHSLSVVLDHALGLDEAGFGDGGEPFLRAMAELRAQAAHDDAYREQFTRSDAYFEGRLAEIVQQGVDAGVFRDVDVDRVAGFLLTTIVGSRTRHATADDVGLGATRDELDAYVRERLLVGDGQAGDVRAVDEQAVDEQDADAGGDDA